MLLETNVPQLMTIHEFSLEKSVLVSSISMNLPASIFAKKKWNNKKCGNSPTRAINILDFRFYLRQSV